ncbi:MAG TPA: choice-of-anchor D domain-containing protein [Solirubrobacteraceae bacterium]
MRTRALLGLTALALAFTAPAKAETFTFTSADAVQTFVVPAGVLSLHLVATGAPGGTGVGGAQGGLGATIAADVVVTPGEQLRIVVGGRGDDGAVCCHSSGESGHGGSGSSGNIGGAGGGPTKVESAFGLRLVVAGGGGGGGGRGTGAGGRGGDAGAPGQAACATSECGGGGGRGALGAAGAGGAASPTAGLGPGDIAGTDGWPGSVYGAGDGGDGLFTAGTRPNDGTGGGGGGGVLGGGGGGSGRQGAGGGGGGGSWSASGATTTVDPAAVPSVTITATAPALAASPSPLHFAPQRLGQATRQLVTVTNQGTGPANLWVGIVARGAQGFEVSRRPCEQLLAPGASCQVTVTFDSGLRGAHTAKLLVGHDGGLAPIEVPLLGYAGSPRLTALRLSRTKFGAGTRVSVRYRADAPGRTSFAVVEDRTGRRIGSASAHLDAAGANRVSFAGRVRRHGRLVALPPGRYRLRAVARNAGGTSSPVTARFSIRG